MATITFKKGDDYLKKLANLELKARSDVIGPAIYVAAEVVADEIREELRKVPTDESWGELAETIGPRKAQKKGLYDSLGIAHMQDDGRGFLNVKIGFDGYNDLRSDRWPRGQPNQMVARSVERGTYFMKANPFVKPVMNRISPTARKIMREKIEEDIERLMSRRRKMKG